MALVVIIRLDGEYLKNVYLEFFWGFLSSSGISHLSMNSTSELPFYQPKLGSVILSIRGDPNHARYAGPPGPGISLQS